MRKRALLVIAVLALLVAVPACGGDGDSAEDTGTGKTDGTPVKGGILRVGSINYIDSLNPFNYIESQAYQAMLMIYPQLVQYAHGRRRPRHRGRLGGVLGDLSGRQGLDVHPQARRDVVGRDAAHGQRRRLDDQHHHRVRGRADRGGGARARACGQRGGDGREHARHPLRRPGRQRARPAGAAVHRPAARLGAAGGRQREEPEDVPSGAEPARRLGRRLHDQGVREEGHDGLHPVGGVLRGGVQRRGRHAHVLHQLGLDDLRAASGQPRLGRPGPVQRREGPGGRRQPRRQQGSRSRDHEHHLELEPAQAEEPGAPRPAGEEGALDVRRP